MLFDPLYLLLALPGLLLGLAASAKTRSTFDRYAQVPASSGLTGAQAARRLLDRNNLRSVSIEPVQGFLGDHYDPRTRTLRLSPGVYGSASLSAVGVACHEAGHAMQHAQAFAPLAIRSALVPAAQFGSHFAYLFFIGGLLLRAPFLVHAGLLFFGAAVLFTLVTLPVEWDASARAKRHLLEAGIVSTGEQPHVAAVLNAAFLTYVASTVSAVMTLLYFLLRSGLLGGRRS